LGLGPGSRYHDVDVEIVLERVSILRKAPPALLETARRCICVLLMLVGIVQKSTRSVYIEVDANTEIRCQNSDRHSAS